jgi:hypothetical protein
MQWLLHGPLSSDPSAVANALVRHEHKIHRPAELELTAESPVEDILKAASAKQWDVITTESALALAPFSQHKWFGRCIVFLQLTGGDVELDDAIDRLFERYPRLGAGRLYTVTTSRVKVRQLPGGR